MTFPNEARRLVLIGDSAVPVPPPKAADGAPSALGAGHTWPADGAPGGSAAGLRFGGPRNPAPPAAGPAGGVTQQLPPAVWLQQPEFAGTTILDPDGWRDGTPFDQYLDHDEFVRRLNRCTITQISHRPAASALLGTEVRDASPAAAGRLRGACDAPDVAGGANAGKSWPTSTTQPAPGAGGPGQAPTSASHSDEGGRASHAARAPYPVRPPQPSNSSAAADGVSRASDAWASPPERGGGSGGDATPTCAAVAASCTCLLGIGHDGPHECDTDTCGGAWYGTAGADDFVPVRLPRIALAFAPFDRHVNEALAAGGFGPVVDPLPRLVEPAPVADPAFREPNGGAS